MTTVTFKDGIVASDSRITGGAGSIFSENNCKFEISKKHACVYMGAGNPSTVGFLIRVLEALDDLPWEVSGNIDLGNDIEDAEFVVITHDFRKFNFQTGAWFEIFSDTVAIGSGSQAAQVAMNLGFSAADAIEAAIAVDSNSGGSIYALDMTNIKHKPAEPMFFAKSKIKPKRITVTP